MTRSINSLIGYTMDAVDGALGRVEEFYFDDETWKIRYIILRTGGWLSGREVLISPSALINAAWKEDTFPVNLTQEQIRNSPSIDTDKPVYRQQEIALHDYYPWPAYWGAGFYPGGVWGITNVFPLVDAPPARRVAGHEKRLGDDLHLRSTSQVTGYAIYAVDGEIGHVRDFMIDPQTWQLEYLVVKTHNGFGGKSVLVSVRHLKSVDWASSEVVVDISMDAIRNSPAYDAPSATRPQDWHTA